MEDRPEQRVTIRRSIEAHIRAPWEVIEVPLFSEPSKIPRWLLENDVQVLVADYLLNEQNEGNSVAPVDYTSDTVIEHIRSMMPNFPVYILTAVPDSFATRPIPSEAEDILQRREFTRDPKTYVARMIRAGQRFSVQFQRELAELSILSEKIAKGIASDDERMRTRALQSLIGLEVTIDAESSRQEILNDLEEKLGKLDQLRIELEASLKTS